jgi:hypothetical protein
MNNKSAFWKAFVFTLIVFVIGLFLGAYFESQRASSIVGVLENSEIDLLDEQVSVKAISDFNVRCDVSKNSVFAFADRIYNEAEKLEKDDQATKFSDGLKVAHKRYDLLRTLLWTQAVEIKKKCGNLHTVVYIYEYNTKDVDKQALQISFSRLVEELKQKHPNEVLLIPIAGNTELSSLETILKEKNIASMPSIIVDEQKVFDKIVSYNELESSVLK